MYDAMPGERVCVGVSKMREIAMRSAINVALSNEGVALSNESSCAVYSTKDTA